MFNEQKQAFLLRKVERRRDEIRNYIHSNRTQITNILLRETLDYETYDFAVDAPGYKPIKAGDYWGGARKGWFKISFVIPEEWKGREVVMFFRFGGEGLVLINGKPYHGLDRNHEEVPILSKAKGGEQIEMVVDAICGAVWDQLDLDTEYSNAPMEISRAEFATRNPEVREYWYSLDVLCELAKNLPEDSTRRASIIATLSKSVDAFDYTHTDDTSLKKSAVAANEILKPLLECRANATELEFSVVGQSHIDAAYRWPFWETRRKCGRTFSTVMRLMERYPDFIYSQGQALLYQFIKEDYPDLYENIKKLAKQGRWDVTGSMWVEADCNLPSGESLVRQILVGKNFYMDEFGVETDVLWLPDVFGYSAALPQILKKARVPYFATNKINWNDTNKPPHGTFHWVGIDGSKVLAHFPPTGNYNAYPDPNCLIHQHGDNWHDKDITRDVLFTYGWGDGGGGPEDRHLELLRREKDLEGLPRCTHTTVPQFFKSINNGTDYPEWVGELYLEYHRGTYTTQARNKKLNRQVEFAYRDAELISSLAMPLGVPYPYAEFSEHWKNILANQFHDVIPGTGIKLVYEETWKDYAAAFEAAEKAIGNSFAKMLEDIDTSGEGEAVIIFNTLPWQRTDTARAKLPDAGIYAVLDAAGNEVPSQILNGELVFTAQAPSMGYATYRLVKKAPAKAKSTLKVNKNSLENRFYKITLDKNGLIKSILHKETGREVLPKGARANLIQLFEDKPVDWPAWDIDFFHEDKRWDITQLKSIRVVEEGPVRAAIEMEREFSASKLRQRIVIYADSPRIDFETWVDWRESYKLLRTAFPVDVNSPTARYEIQFGNVERPTHRNTSWDFAKFEVCAHKWADLSERGFGMSLINDCKYGHSTHGNTMRLTLLRAPKIPDQFADMCEHEFTYSIVPHSGGYIEAETVHRAYEMNVPMRTVIAPASKGTQPPVRSFFSVDADNVILETVKKAEKEEALILRFYECHNKRTQVTLNTELDFKEVFECDLMEDNIGKIDSNNRSFSFEIKPFEIRTFKIRVMGVGC